MDSESYSDSMDEGSDSDNLNDSVGKAKGRRNIRHIKKNKDLCKETRAATRDEEKRVKRIEQMEEEFSKAFPEKDFEDQLILDFDVQTKQPLISVHPELVKRLKNHQRKGVKFMWNACYESIEQIKKSEGSGCIIAHCMGLGKTFQVIALVHTLLNNPQVNCRTILVCCPKNTVLNWMNEFKIWIKPEIGDINVYNITRFDTHSGRLSELTKWQTRGGVCLVNYELFRIIVENETKQFPTHQKKKFLDALCNPGPDLVICDEGHVLKNEETKLSKAMSQIRTLRRIVLTGTPMQNNLKEYHCMVQFVKPNLLGSRTEFLNMFVNPILNGQYENSLEEDVRLMKERSHILHKTLSGCVQRYDLATLTRFLPEKQEYVIALRLSDCQVEMYRFYLDHYSAKRDFDYEAKSTALFADHQTLQRVWTHPYLLKLYKEKYEELMTKPRKSKPKKKKKFSEEDDDDDSSADNMPDFRRRPLTWWTRFVTSDDVNDIRKSSKLILLLEILKECENMNEKLLLFSGSLYTLRTIEHFLKKINSSEFEDPALGDLTSTWEKDVDYFVMTGETPVEDRAKFCKQFNNVHDTRGRLFLISTKAGGIGINLTAANRAIIFDASWNPSYDIQSIFRIYRLGQTKQCYVYRFLASGTMEEKIYERQVTKQSISRRVVDEKQIARHYTENELLELYQFEPDKVYTKALKPPRDPLLKKLLEAHSDIVASYHEHDSLLEHLHEEELHETEKTGAWDAYNVINNPDSLTDEEKKLLSKMIPSNFDPNFLKYVLKEKYTDANDSDIDFLLEQLMPRVNEVLNQPNFSDIMKREAIYAKNKRLSFTHSSNFRSFGEVGGNMSGMGSFFNNNDPMVVEQLSYGKARNYFTTLKKRSTARRKRARSKPLNVWGSVGGRDYGNPDTD